MGNLKGVLVVDPDYAGFTKYVAVLLALAFKMEFFLGSRQGPRAVPLYALDKEGLAYFSRYLVPVHPSPHFVLSWEDLYAFFCAVVHHPIPVPPFHVLEQI